MASWTTTVGERQLTTGIGLAVAALDGLSEADVTLRTDIDVPASGVRSAGLDARYGGTGDENYYGGAVVGVKGSFTAQIWRNVEGKQRLLSRQAIPDGSATLRFEAIGDSLKLFLDDRVVGNAFDSALPAAGQAGVRGSGDINRPIPFNVDVPDDSYFLIGGYPMDGNRVVDYVFSGKEFDRGELFTGDDDIIPPSYGGITAPALVHGTTETHWLPRRVGNSSYELGVSFYTSWA
jgi:hypothetical protein